MTSSREPGTPAPFNRRTFLNASLGGVAGLMLGPAALAATDALAFLSIHEAATQLRARKISPVELTRACLARIQALNPPLNAFITVTADSALEEAKRAEFEIMHGKWRGPLHGIPLALKDLIDTAGVLTTAASAVFEDRIPEQDAAVVERLKAAGAVLLGKLNLQEFAYGATSVPSYYGRVCNPWDPARITGGSSGGPAAAVAAGLCYGALGSDSGGSIREPAALCAVVGLKPTYGRVSNRGVLPLSWSLDHVGPLTRTVRDAAIMLAAIAGYDPRDTTSADRPVGSYVGSLGRERTRLRVGLPREFFFANLDAEIQAAIDEALRVLESVGAQLQDIPLEVSTDRTIIRAEAYAYHAEYIAKDPDLYFPETLAKLRSGADIDAPTYIRARRDLDRLRRSTLGVFSSVDLLVTPTTALLAPNASDYPSSIEGAMALDASLLRNTRPFNLSGLPTISIPCGFSRSGLPIGLQLSGAPWDEQRVVALAQAYQDATSWHTRRPPLFA
jgi:aspartyl-tRNA(Asn)/glutamyl-tRNA(Gln) amidotransferase subunit A